MERLADDEPGVVDDELIARRLADIKPRADPGRYELVMRNRETGNELIVELEPSFSIENMVRSAARWRSLYLPWLYDGIVVTAHRDDPSLIPAQPRQRLGTPHLRPRREVDPAAAEEPSGSRDALGRFVPTWRRKRHP